MRFWSSLSPFRPKRKNLSNLVFKSNNWSFICKDQCYSCWEFRDEKHIISDLKISLTDWNEYHLNNLYRTVMIAKTRSPTMFYERRGFFFCLWIWEDILQATRFEDLEQSCLVEQLRKVEHTTIPALGKVRWEGQKFKVILSAMWWVWAQPGLHETLHIHFLRRQSWL